MHPIFIAGAAVVGLPILLHLLLRQQPKRLVFPALRFLKLRQKTSQRRVQLRHIILLLLRCLLLALFALALYQPTVTSAGGINLSGEEPIAAVLIIDTSPSMGYRDGTTRLEEARRRAADLLNELPPRSKVAVLSTHDPTGTWQPTVLEARQRIDELKEPSGSAQSLGPALARAYELLHSADEDNPPGTDPLPRLVAVFGDRTLASWDAKEMSGLAGKRDDVPQPAPVHLFFDVGADRPTNLAITDVRMESDRLSGAADAVLTALVRADGPDVNELVVTAQLDDGRVETAVLNVPGGGTQAATFTFKSPAVGFHSAVVKLDRDDLLPFDNERTFTFEVQPRRNILAIADDPADADFWRLSHNVGKQEFDCTVVTPDKLPPLGGFEMVAVIAVADPGPMAKQLMEYVQGGGKLLLAPDGPKSDADPKWADRYNDGLSSLLPAQLGPVKVLQAADGKTGGVPWKIDEEQDLLRHKMLTPLVEWQKGNYDLFKNPRTVSKYRSLEPPVFSKVVWYADADTQAARTPAVVERTYDKGTVVLLTTRIDTSASNVVDGWNDYWLRDGHSWGVVFPWLVTKYLCDLGSEPVTAEAGGKRRYNFPTGSEVKVSTRGFAPQGERKLRLEGPGVSADRSKFTLPADVTELTLTNKPKEKRLGPDGQPVPPPPGTWELEGDPLLTPGAFALQPDGAESPWQFRFSLAVPPAESDLNKVPEETIAELFGPKNVIRLDQQVPLGEYIIPKFNRPFELFPALIIGVLLFFAFEAIMANRFYKLK